jgi:hypothetical protein
MYEALWARSFGESFRQNGFDCARLVSIAVDSDLAQKIAVTPLRGECCAAIIADILIRYITFENDGEGALICLNIESFGVLDRLRVT